ncbi:Cytochrome c peroxidase, mitochondrial [Tetrabaena socialis]|uniref:Cytochrome c peroxidase, mitochondrial n=1 Tax=Tetrabaena socialis TaxID=47790 RepID=A0A2J8AE86_9CHLO|nr:Cytochrome c peroxidase, mitochondrial [Tetrabaena socialis]|eukprot:PNH10822.1 Cytochrome c peroxidase, mitochondrial [Tetrabaena socialis]
MASASSAPLRRLGALLARQGMPLQQGLRTFSEKAAPEVAKAAPEVAKAAPEAGSSGSSKIRAFQMLLFGGLGGGFVYGYSLFTSQPPRTGAIAGPPTLATGSSKKTSTPGDYGAVRASISSALDVEDYDDGSYGPLLVRLAWHTSGTYDKASGTGGSNGATMRRVLFAGLVAGFGPECDWGANKGLAIARKLLEPIKAAHPWISYADLWTLAGVVAIEDMGGAWGRVGGTPPALSQIRVPVLVIQGTQDRAVPLEAARQVEAAFRLRGPGCVTEMFVLEGCGHVPMDEMPLEVLRAMVDFINRECCEPGRSTPL